MSLFSPRSPAEAGDSLAGLTAVVAGIAAIIYAANVAEAFIDGGLAPIVGYGQIALGVLIVAFYLPVVLFLKSRRSSGGGAQSEEGFLNAVMRKATSTAFELTVAFAVLLGLMERTVLSHLTAKSVSDLVVAFALGAFAVSYFVFNRFSDENGAEA